MKALSEMNNTERAFILAKLLPEHLEEFIKFIKSEIEHFRTNEQEIRNAWAKNVIATADYWFMLIENAERIINDFNVTLHRSPRIFADQLFYSHNSVFAIHCLIRFVGSAGATHKVRLAIELLFGEEEVRTMEFTKI